MTAVIPWHCGTCRSTTTRRRNGCGDPWHEQLRDHQRSKTSRPATSGGYRYRLGAGICGHPTPSGGHCDATDGVRDYLVGPRCDQHSPAAVKALFGEPHPARTKEAQP